MEFFDVVKKRCSIRVFSSQLVEDRKLQQILEAANQAPSAGNLQAYEIYVVRKAFQRNELAKAALNQHFIAQAPVVLVFCAHPARSEGRYFQRGVRLYSVQDASIACTFAMLAATALGLGSVWVGAFDDQSVHRVIGAPPGLLPVAVLPVGYAAESPSSTPRRQVNDIVHWL